ncbi:peritrophin-1-like isoform X2 [Pomacea canaliculata]|uniref:peritrophin-1-like isoform X2 n=1 Tax=Pomacea canaliculata TaxID=400727 RepID=UPI000D731DCB|nr:peritrophin-1-like isoform X2 [Pomacea canaliculata]
MATGRLPFVLVLLGCLLRVTPSASAAFSCGTQDLGFYPHPTSCTQFLGCVYGQQYTMHCPSGLNFNPTLHLCDWPDNAGCVVPPAPQTQISPCTGCDLSSLCPSHVTYYQFPDWTDCTAYYICTRGVVSRVTCPSGLYYHFLQWSCAQQEDAPCFQA